MAQESLSLPYIALSGTVFLALVASLVLFRPQITHWQATRAEVADLQTKLREKQVFLRTIDQKTAELQANAAADRELSVAVPTEEAFADVVRLLDRHATTAGVRIKKVDNTTAGVQTANRVAAALGDATDVPTNLTVHGAKISLEGTYQQVRQFFGLLENTARFTDVTDITFSEAADQPDVLDGSLNINFYSLSTAP